MKQENPSDTNEDNIKRCLARFLELNCISLSKAAGDEFFNSRLKEKTWQLFDSIPKTKNIENKKITSQIKHDATKETVKFLYYIDYACKWKSDLKLLMQSKTFFLSPKKCFVKKSTQSQCTMELKTMISKPI